MNALAGRNTGRGREFQAPGREYSWKVNGELEASTCVSSSTLPTGREREPTLSLNSEAHTFEQNIRTEEKIPS